MTRRCPVSPEDAPTRVAPSDRNAWQSGVEMVAPGIHRVPMPLPGDGLRAVNVYVIEQDEDVVLIDAGWALGEAWGNLEGSLHGLGYDLGCIRRVLVTHVHRDHYELAIHLRRRYGVELAVGVGERPSLELMVDDSSEAHVGMIDRLRRAGAAVLVPAFDRLLSGDLREGGVPPVAWELPDTWLYKDQVVELTDRALRVVATPGHTRGHVVFVDELEGLMFAGDHVLPHITPSIGFEKYPAQTSLDDYMASLARVRSMPDSRLLPAHGPPGGSVHERADELLAHHDTRLEQVRVAVVRGAITALEVASRLVWTRHAIPFGDLDPFNQILAVNETLAHLDVLVRRRQIADVPDGLTPRAVSEFSS